MFKRPGTSRPHLRRAAPAGFTLVEMLTVIVIIGILMALVSGAVVTARAFARQASVRSEMDHLKMALQNYEIKNGELPADATDATLFMRHLNRVYPRFDTSAYGANATAQFAGLRSALQSAYSRWNSNANYDISKLDSAAALVLWLAGPPDPSSLVKDSTTNQWVMTRPGGFSANPADPFDLGAQKLANRSTSRMASLFEFVETRLQANNYGCIRYCPDFGSGVSAQSPPYVYFRARTKGVANPNSTTVAAGYDPKGSYGSGQVFSFTGISGPEMVYPYYYTSSSAKGAGWAELRGFQLICAGQDGKFGTSYCLPLGTTAGGTLAAYNKAGAGDEADNLAQFVTGKIEDVK